MNVLVVDFNKSKGHYESRIELINDVNKLDEFYRIIDCRTIDIIPYNKELSIIVDDEGLFVSDNIRHELLADEIHPHPLQLAGKLIFVKDKTTDKGIEMIGLDAGDILNLNMDLKIRPINWRE